MGWGGPGSVLMAECLSDRGAGAARMRASGGWGSFPLSTVALQNYDVQADLLRLVDQATGPRPAGIARMHGPLGHLCVAALGLLPLTLFLLLPRFSASLLDPVFAFTASFAACGTNDRRRALGQRPDVFSCVCALLGCPWFAAPDPFPLAVRFLRVPMHFLQVFICKKSQMLATLARVRLPRVGLQNIPLAQQ